MAESEELPRVAIRGPMSEDELIEAALRQESAPPRSLAPAPRLPERIGRYKIIRRLGTGGMGVVYEAEQEEPIRRRVALKVIRVGLDSADALARFDVERQALAQMDHPHIATVFDAGTTEQGQPFLAMEYVRGTRITEYCDEHRLTTGERLKLFARVCHGVQHAHQKGVIHRDIKPSNVLVATHDGEPVPKVIDFGVAKAIDQRLTDRTLLTETGQFVGTLEYMSPEQADPLSHDVDTRTDVYSLGVLLYQLLTGAPPFVSAELRGRGLSELQRVIREQDPLRPSTRVSRPSIDAALVVANRRTDLRTLRRQLSGDLDWITMKALEKDRGRRYDSAAELAADIERHLRNEPVLAGRPGVAYRVRKFVRRNRAAVIGVAAVFLVLTAGIVASTVLAIGQSRARVEERRQRYVACVTAAGRALSMREVLPAKRSLAAAPPEFRGWEWYYLNSATDESLTTMRGHTARVDGAAFSPDGTLVASAAGDHTACIWEVLSGRLLRTLRGHSDRVYAAAFRPTDGLQLATASGDGTVRLWDVTTGQESLRLVGHADQVWQAVYSTDGTRVATSSADGTVRIWSAETGEGLIVLRRPGVGCFSVALSPDGKRVASAGDDADTTVCIWDAVTGEPLHVLRGHERCLSSVEFSPDGTRVLSGSKDNTLRLWDTDTGQPIATLAGHTDAISCVAFSPDGAKLASASWDETVRIWDANSHAELAALLGHEDNVMHVAFSRDGDRLVTTSFDETVRIWDASSDGAEGVLRCGSGRVGSVAFSPDGMLLASASDDGVVRIWDVSTADVIAILPRQTVHGSCLAFDSTGNHLASSYADNGVGLWDAATGELCLVFTGHADYVSSVAFSPDGTLLASTSYDETIRVWQVSSGAQLGLLRSPDGGVPSIAFSPDGSRLASASRDGTVRLWDVSTGAQRRSLHGHTDLVCSVAFSPGGDRLATASEDRTLRIWNTHTGDQENVLRGHQDVVSAVAFSPDGRRLASAANDRTVRIWDADTGDELLVLRGTNSSVQTVAFSPDGRKLASGWADGTIRIWDTEPHRVRCLERERMRAAQPQAEALVADLWDELCDAKKVVERPRADSSLAAR